MNHQKITKIEALHQQGNKADLKLQSFSLATSDESEPLKIMACRPASNYNTYHYQDTPSKEKIVIHHTAGHLQGDLRALSQKNYHVSVAFVIARDGTIYQMHHSKKWSYHLGRNALGGNKTQSKSSIGIELSNYGYLVPKGNNLETYHSRTNGSKSVDVYCTKAETDLYVKLDKQYRRFSYYASFTDAQYTQLIKLIRYLSKEYDIPIAFLPETVRYKTTNEVVDFKGIVSHVNYRKDKFDIGPAFNWNRLINGLNGTELDLNQATQAFEVAEKDFQVLQVKVWESDTEKSKNLAALNQAEQNLIATHLTLQRLKLQLQYKEQSTSDTSSTSTENDIDKAMPLVGTRGVKDYGEDGPEEQIFDYSVSY